MKAFLAIVKEVTRFLLEIFVPIILIVLGGLLVGWAFPNDYTILSWTGLVMIAAGVFWGIVILGYYGAID